MKPVTRFIARLLVFKFCLILFSLSASSSLEADSNLKVETQESYAATIEADGPLAQQCGRENIDRTFRTNEPTLKRNFNSYAALVLLIDEWWHSEIVLYTVRTTPLAIQAAQAELLFPFHYFL